MVKLPDPVLEREVERLHCVGVMAEDRPQSGVGATQTYSCEAYICMCRGSLTAPVSIASKDESVQALTDSEEKWSPVGNKDRILFLCFSPRSVTD